MKKSISKILSLLMAVCLVLTLLPITASAGAAFNGYSVFSSGGDFGTVSLDYQNQPAKELSLLFSGVTAPITGIQATLGQGNYSAFEITSAITPTTVNSDPDIPKISFRPKTGLSGGTYTDKLIIKDDNDLFSHEVALSFTVLYYTYTCTVSPSAITFPDAMTDYDNSSMAQEFTITNTGTGQLAGLSTALQKGAASSFEIITPSAISIDPGNTATVGIRPKSGLGAETYTDTLVITGDHGAAASAELSFKVNQNPYFALPPSNQSTSAGGNASFAVIAEGIPSPSYLWYESPNGISWNSLENEGIYSGTTSSAIMLTGVPAAYNGYQYRCHISNSNGSTYSTAATLTVTGGITGTVTGTMNISNRPGVNLISDATGKGWDWNAYSSTLTLNSSYSGNSIEIKCSNGSNINLVLTGDVSINANLWAISMSGLNYNDTDISLTIKAGSHTLSLASGMAIALQAQGSIIIESGTVLASGDCHGISTAFGDVIIRGNSNLTTTGGIVGSGIQANGDIIIGTSGTVNATGNICGLRPVEGGITISSGTVKASGGMYEALHGGNGDTGITISGGTVTTGDIAGSNGKVYGNITISGSATNVAINGNVSGGSLKIAGGTVTIGDIASLNGTVYSDITINGSAANVTINGNTIGSLNVSNGTVTIKGKAEGSQNLTGGIVYVDGVKVYPTAVSDGGSNKGSVSSDSGKISITVSGSTAITAITASTDANGKAKITIPQTKIKEALAKAKEAADKAGEKPQLEIKLDKTESAAETQVTLTTASIKDIVSGGISSLTISSGLGTVTFDEAALKKISDTASNDVDISVAKLDISAYSEDIRKIIGSRPVYSFTVTSSGKIISQLGGAVTASMPYTPAPGEDTNAIIIYYINDTGSLETVTSGHYDADTGTVIFTTDHFSAYAVGYNKVSFNDVSKNAWYSDAVTFLAARGITGGTAPSAFSPDKALTRGQFITFVMKAYGIASDKNLENNFADAGNTYYTGYLAAAKRLGISGGTGENRFSPERTVTRQEMFTLLYNTLKTIGRLPESNSGTSVSEFSDAGSIASWAKPAMDYLVKAGKISGNGGKLSPAEITTRGQMAQVLYNLLTNTN